MYSSKLYWTKATILSCSILASLLLPEPSLALDFTAVADKQGSQSASSSTDSLPDWYLHAELKSSNSDTHDRSTAPSIVQVDVISGSLQQKKQEPFESFWFLNGKTRGLKTAGQLKIPGGQRVAITLGQKTYLSISETKAAAGAILRLVLSVLLNRDQVAQVILPDASYQSIAAELESRNGRLMPPGEAAPEEARVKFVLQSESGRSKQTMYFL